jgi:hypothetical protein
MPRKSRLDHARSILGDDVIGPEEIEAALGKVKIAAKPPSVPFPPAELEAAKSAGEMLVLRSTQTADGKPLTILSLIQAFPNLFDSKSLRNVGYQLKNEWGIELEPLAATATCASGWALVTKEVIPASINRDYVEQEAELAAHAARVGATTASVRRRTAVESVYDLVVYQAVRNSRLLEKDWDWSASCTVDGALLSVGGFTETGMQIFGYSAGIHHGSLGLCPTRGRKR